MTPNCVAPINVDASRDFYYYYYYYFLRTSSARGGGGGALPDFVFFFGLATNALNVRNNFIVLYIKKSYLDLEKILSSS